MTSIRRGFTTREALIALPVFAGIAAVVYFSGGLQFAIETATILFKGGKETVANVSKVIESEKSPRVMVRVEGGLDNFRTIVVLEKAPGELKHVHAVITADSPDGKKVV